MTLSEGSHTFSVKGTDLSGNLGTATAPVTARVVDTTLVSGPGDRSNATTTTFTFSSLVGTTFDCSLDSGAYASCATKAADGTGRTTLSALADGTHTFRVKARDGSEFDRVPVVRTWVVDTVAPTAVLDPTAGPGEGAKQASTTETFVFTADDPDATFRCRLDRAAFAACTSPWTVSGVRPGPHRFEVRATDQAGNTSATVARSWTVAGVVAPQKATLKLAAKAGRRTTAISTLTVKGLSKGAKVVLRCKGRGCPAKLSGRGVTATARGGSLAFGRQVRKPLRAGSRLVITARIAGWTTTFTVKIRAGAKPVVTRR